MVDRNLEGVPSAKGRGGAQGVIRGIGASFPRKVHRHGGASSRVLGMIGPAFGSGLLSDLCRLQRNRRIPFAIETLGAFKAYANAPIGLVAKAKKQDGKMCRMRGLRTG